MSETQDINGKESSKRNWAKKLLWTAIRSFDIDTGGAPPRRRIFIIN